MTTMAMARWEGREEGGGGRGGGDDDGGGGGGGGLFVLQGAGNMFFDGLCRFSGVFDRR
jgi:hypothetical protein